MESQREESEEDLLFAEIEALQQGSRELVEYLESTERVLVQAPAGWERYVAEIFVAGIADEELRAQVESDLNREGWAWQRVRETVSRTADRGKRKRKRRYIVRPEDMAEYMKVTP